MVRELDLEDGVDTLAKWMAHHVAELIHDSETLPTDEKRAKAGKRAVETILKIWEHRESLPSYAYPLARYNEVLRVLDRFQLNENPFRNYGQDMGTRTDQLAAILFNNLSRLIMVLLLTKLKSIRAEALDDDVFQALTEEEQRVWTTFLQWNELFEASPKRSTRKTKKKRVDAKSVEIDFSTIAIELLDAIMTTLVDLKGELQTAAAKA